MPLMVVPTPVGNLEDITLRALRVLSEADVVACEDTRHTGMLLHCHGIRAKLLSYHRHNEVARTREILSMLRDGMTVALVSDAGTPGISDPGYELIKEAVNEGVPMDILPGATAFVPAVLLSGLPPQPCLFYGFLPDKTGERGKCLRELSRFPWTVVFYVSPHKLLSHMNHVLSIFGDRPCALIREISKIHQEPLRGLLSEVRSKVSNGVKGELVLVVGGASDNHASEDWRPKAQELLEKGLSDREALAVLVELGIPKNAAKKWILEQKRVQ
ncbi:MAG: 16S rRNA (cytidine(1402)-2'-O)-methyltransferase [Dethiosulfovibrio peptidovorans]|nr:MAG: 16S rRNA (cytidine(1402)-2'-O)-methyltransferase [Dethiosulfovibrio peptidovorans]